MATITDKFSKIGTGVRPVTTTVDGTRATSGATLSCADLTGWDTDTAVHGVTYKVDGQGAIVAGSQLDFKGIVSGNTITNFTVTGGTDAGNAVGDIVQATPTAAWAKDLADGLLATLDEDGTIKAGGVDNAAALASNVVTTAKILDSNVTTAKLADSSVTNTKLNLSGTQTATVATNQTTTSTTYVDLATAGPAVTVTIGASGLALVILDAKSSEPGGAQSYMSYAVSGANTIAASDTTSVLFYEVAKASRTITKLHTGLTPGSTTFTAKYRAGAGTAAYENRNITVIPL